MQVANALNNQIRILFNPSIENFKLFDFLIVKSNEDKYLAQIIEIYDDKFDASQNVAKLKLFYKITKDDEVIPYDSFTPNKECEIIKIKQEEVEEFINQDKKIFQFGINAKNSLPLNIQYEFFNNNPIILADKIENANTISLSLAMKLSSEKNVAIIDSTGILEYNEIPKIKASKDFRIPLNYQTIDFVFEKCLKDASLEFQSIVGAILNEIKKFAKHQENEFIPFNAFVRVLLEQYKATPYPELKILISKLKKFQMDDVFARSKKDLEKLINSIKENKITIIDISSASSSWQKAYLDYITEAIQDEIYLLTRINDENSDVDLINKIYNCKKNINFIPNVSYNFKKLPSIIQNCKNYILLPSLYQRNDFLDANFALCNLISDGCIIFGENTDNFLYLIKNFEPEVKEQKKIYRKIALSLLDDEEKQTEEKLGEQGDYFENFQKEMEEKNSSSQQIQKEENEFEHVEDYKGEITNDDDEFQNLSNYSEEDSSSVIDEIQETKEEQVQEAIEEKIDEPEETEIFREIPNHQTEEEYIDLIPEDKKEEILKEEPKEEKNEDFLGETIEEETIDLLEISETSKEEVQIKETEEEPKKEETKDEELPLDDMETDLSEDDLDFFQIAKESSATIEEKEEEKPKEEKKIDKSNFDIIDLSEDNDIDLNAVAQSSIDESFEQIIESVNVGQTQTINIDDAQINLENLNNNAEEKENLPIFKEQQEETVEQKEYKIGDSVIHGKYGKGKVTKTMRYENRQLLQIEFEQAGKKLLDPKIANVKLDQ